MQATTPRLGWVILVRQHQPTSSQQLLANRHKRCCKQVGALVADVQRHSVSEPHLQLLVVLSMYGTLQCISTDHTTERPGSVQRCMMSERCTGNSKADCTQPNKQHPNTPPRAVHHSLWRCNSSHSSSGGCKLARSSRVLRRVMHRQCTRKLNRHTTRARDRELGARTAELRQC